MFPSGTPDMSALLAQAQQLQEQLVAAQETLAETQVSGSAASGLVTATVTGTGELIEVSIKPEACDPDDAETLGDMVVAAVRDATESAEQLAAERLGPLAGGLEGMGGLGDALGAGMPSELAAGDDPSGPDTVGDGAEARPPGSLPPGF